MNQYKVMSKLSYKVGQRKTTFKKVAKPPTQRSKSEKLEKPYLIQDNLDCRAGKKPRLQKKPSYIAAPNTPSYR